MKQNSLVLICLLLSLGLYGCRPTSFSNPVDSTGHIPSTQTIQSNRIITSYSSSTVSPSPVPTYTKSERDMFLQKMISEPLDCAAPCFFGITPGKTTSREAADIIKNYGLDLYTITNEGKTTISFYYDLPNGIRISTGMPLLGDVIETITFSLTQNPLQEGTWNGWAAYSPQTLIEEYGQPSEVEFAAAFGPDSHNSLSMVMYFPQVDLIVNYFADNVDYLNENMTYLCPLIIKYSYVELWFGKKPLYPPVKANPLENLTSLSIKQFSDLLMGDLKKACFEINGNDLFH